MMISYRFSIAALLVASPAFSQIRGRPSIADSSAVQIMARLGSHPGPAWIKDVLRQADGQESASKLDEIADSLVGRATDPRQVGGNPTAHASASEAVGALVIAGLIGPIQGRPYSGAFDRLVRVHQRATAADVRARALAGLLSVTLPRTRAIAYLREVAESKDPTAYSAMEFLITDARGGSWGGISPTPPQQQESATALRGMVATQRVTDPRAIELLSGWVASMQSLKKK